VRVKLTARTAIGTLAVATTYEREPSPAGLIIPGPTTHTLDGETITQERASQILEDLHGGVLSLVEQCPDQYERAGGRERGDRIVHCHLSVGHRGPHIELDTDSTWTSE
jgi:hypothetical protein